MLLITLFLLALFIGFPLGLLTTSGKTAFRRRRTTWVPVKILTPPDNPWGSLSELIEWAEARAVREHRQAYSDPITEELERRFREAVRTEKATVLEDMHFTTINEKREAAGYIRMESSRYGRYIDDIGYVTADSPELLNRACEVVLTRHWDNKARGVLHAIEALNNQTLGQ